MNATETKQESRVINIKDLSDTFKMNEAVAEKQYFGTMVTVKGIARYVGPDIYGLPSVEMTDKEGGVYYALCVLSFTDYPKLVGVKKGQEVIMTGECRYFTDVRDDKDILILKQCKFVAK